MNQINFDKVSKIVCSSLMFSPILPVIHSEHSSITEKFANLTITDYIDIENKISDSKYASHNYQFDLDESHISLNQLNDLINQSRDKLTYKLLFAGASCSEENPQVQNIVGTYLHNVIPPTNELNAEGLQQQYAKVLQENEKVGIDVVDWNQCKNLTIPNVIDKYLESYKNSYDPTEKQLNNLKYVLLNSYIEIATEEADNLDSQIDLALALVDNHTMDQMNPEIDHNQARISAKLQAILKYEQSQFNHHQFQTNSSSPEFLRYISDYTNDGVTTPDPLISALNVGSVVPEKLLKYLLTYNYDTVYGADYADAEYMGFDITPDEICANTNSEYDELALDLCLYTQPLSSLQTAYCTYGVGEFLPGYALELAIKSIDDTTDSHQCKMVFTKGVGYTNSNGEKQILWETKDGTLETANDDTQGDLEITILINDNYSDIVKNISSNVYYQNEEVYVPCTESFVLNKNNAYFDSSVSTRKKLDEILADYTGDVYDFEKNPFYITGSNIENVLPSDLKYPMPNDSLDDYMHTNQRIALIPTKVDSNVYTMTLRCGYIDTIPVDDVTKQSKPNVVKYISFNLGGSIKLDEINVQFDISSELKTKIQYSKSMFSNMQALNVLIDSFKGTTIGEKKIDQIQAINKASITSHITYAAVSESALLANEVSNITFVVTAALQFSTQSSFIAALVFADAIKALAKNSSCLVTTIKDEVAVVSEKKVANNEMETIKTLLKDSYQSKSTQNIIDTFDKIKVEFKTEFSDFGKDYNPLFQNNATFGLKLEAAQIVIKYCNTQSFLNNLNDCFKTFNVVKANNGLTSNEFCCPINFSNVKSNLKKISFINHCDSNYALNYDTMVFDAITNSQANLSNEFLNKTTLLLKVLDSLEEDWLNKIKVDLEKKLEAVEDTIFQTAEEKSNNSLSLLLDASNVFGFQIPFDERNIQIYNLKEFLQIATTIGCDVGEMSYRLQPLWEEAKVYKIDDNELLNTYLEAFANVKNDKTLIDTFRNFVQQKAKDEHVKISDILLHSCPTDFIPIECQTVILKSQQTANKFATKLFDDTKKLLCKSFYSYIYEQSDKFKTKFNLDPAIKQVFESDSTKKDLDKFFQNFSNDNIKNVVKNNFKDENNSTTEKVFKKVINNLIKKLSKATKSRGEIGGMGQINIALNPILKAVIKYLSKILNYTKDAFLDYFDIA